MPRPLMRRSRLCFWKGKGADASGNIWETSDAIKGQHGSKRSGEKANRSLAIQSGEFPPHRQQDRCALLSLGFRARHGQSLPPHPAAGECNYCAWEAAFMQTCDKGTPQSNNCKEGPYNAKQRPRPQLKMYNLSLTSLSAIACCHSPQKRL